MIYIIKYMFKKITQCLYICNVRYLFEIILCEYQINKLLKFI